MTHLEDRLTNTSASPLKKLKRIGLSLAVGAVSGVLMRGAFEVMDPSKTEFDIYIANGLAITAGVAMTISTYLFSADDYLAPY